MVKYNLLLDKELREMVINEERIDILDSIKEIINIPNTKLSTRIQVAEYYGVKESAIRQIETRNSDEIESDGFKMYSRKELEEFLNVQSVRLEKESKVTKVYDNANNFITNITNRGLVLYTKRAILRIAMLLDISPIAKEVRTMLLDNREQLENINEKLINDEEITLDESNPNYFINKETELREKEKQLYPKMVEAISKGNMSEYMTINCEMNKIKEDIIALGKEKEELFKPKADLYDKFLNSNSTYSFTDTSKMISTLAEEEKSDISISVSKLTEFLRNKGVLCKTKTPDKVKEDGSLKKGKYKNLPNKDYEDMFDTISVKVNGFNTVQTRVKSNGVQYIYEELKKVL